MTKYPAALYHWESLVGRDRGHRGKVMSANDLDPISAAIKKSRDQQQTQINKAAQIASITQQNLVKVADKALNAITGAFNRIAFFGGNAHGFTEAFKTEPGKQSIVIKVVLQPKDGINVSAAAQLTWVDGDGINIGHGEGGDVIGIVTGPSGKSVSYRYPVGQQPFLGNYSVDAVSLVRIIAEAVAQVAG